MGKQSALMDPATVQNFMRTIELGAPGLDHDDWEWFGNLTHVMTEGQVGGDTMRLLGIPLNTQDLKRAERRGMMIIARLHITQPMAALAASHAKGMGADKVRKMVRDAIKEP